MNDQGSHISTLQLHHSRVAWQNWFLSNLISHEISILSLRYRHDLPKGWADMWHIWIKGETQDIPRPLAGHKEIEILEEYLASPDPNVKLEEDAGHLSWRPAGRSTNGCRTRDPWNFGVFTTRFGIWNGTLQDFPDTASIENLLKKKKQLLSHPPGTGTKEQPGTEELAQKNWTWWVYAVYATEFLR